MIWVKSTTNIDCLINNDSISEERPASTFQYFGLEAKATNFVAFQTVDELKESLIQRADHPLLVLGGGK